MISRTASRPPVLNASVVRLPPPTSTGDTARVSIAGHPLTATAALVWNGNLPRPLQQILFDVAHGVTAPQPFSPPAAQPGQQYGADLMSGDTPALADCWN